MSWIDIVGYSAALAVLAAFCMSSIVPLRIVAILSNVLFALYGLSAHLYPVFLLHSILLPINVFKLTHVELLPRMAGLRSASASGQGRPFRSRAVDYSHSHLIDDLRTCGSSVHQTIVPSPSCPSHSCTNQTLIPREIATAPSAGANTSVTIAGATLRIID